MSIPTKQTLISICLSINFDPANNWKDIILCWNCDCLLDCKIVDELHVSDDCRGETVARKDSTLDL